MVATLNGPLFFFWSTDQSQHKQALSWWSNYWFSIILLAETTWGKGIIAGSVSQHNTINKLQVVLAATIIIRKYMGAREGLFLKSHLSHSCPFQ